MGGITKQILRNKKRIICQNDDNLEIIDGSGRSDALQSIWNNELCTGGVFKLPSVDNKQCDGTRR